MEPEVLLIIGAAAGTFASAAGAILAIVKERAAAMARKRPDRASESGSGDVRIVIEDEGRTVNLGSLSAREVDEIVLALREQRGRDVE